MTDPLLTATARRQVARLLRDLAPGAGKLERRFGTILRNRGFDALQVKALLAIAPSAAASLASLRQFLEQVEYNGRRLAKLNVQPDDICNSLKAFGLLLDAAMHGQFEPAREQLYLATVLALNDAYYQVREAETQAFFGLYMAESQASSLDDLLQRFVRILTRTFRAQAGRLLLLDEPSKGALREPLFIESGHRTEKWIADLAMRGVHASYWSFPMGTEGLMQFGFATRYPWLPREATLMDAVAERCRNAIGKARLQAEVRRLEAEARRGEEEERRRIGRELHDEAGQSLLLLRLQLEMIERDAPEALRTRLAEARGVAEHTVEELRRIVSALSPAVLERLGLAPAVRQLAARFRKMHGAKVAVRISGACQGVCRQSQQVIYRVAQESLQNIAKHSQATRVNLLLRSTDKNIRLSITDNGAGFREEAATSKPMSFGLAGMRERAALLHGTLAVRSVPGKGVTVILELPRSSHGDFHA